VEALAPDASSLSSARALASGVNWSEANHARGAPPTLWGLCRGSGAKPYQTCVDLVEPAYKCSCPSRKFPCKHALGLLLLWSAGSVVETDAADAPEWVREWHAGRAGRAATREARKATERGETTPAQERAAQRRAAQRADRVNAGLAELDRWLLDQVRGGIAGLDRVGYRHFDQMAARLVDSQAPGAAGDVRRLAGVAASGAGWPGRMLADLGLLRLLTGAYRRIADLPEPLAATVRGRVGFTVPTEQVLAAPPVRDEWQVIGVRDEFDERLVTRRSWLIGRGTCRPALVLSFAMPGQPLAADLVVGTAVDADLCFYPGAQPLRAVAAHRHDAPQPFTEPSPSAGVEAALTGYADAVAGDPWLTQWPVLVRGTLVRGSQWQLVDAAGDALPLHPAAGEPWRLLAAGGGHPTVLAGEWGPAGLRPLTCFVDGEAVRA